LCCALINTRSQISTSLITLSVMFPQSKRVIITKETKELYGNIASMHKQDE